MRHGSWPGRPSLPKDRERPIGLRSGAGSSLVAFGAKPQAFNRWILDLLGFVDGDQLDDLYPGTRGMARALDAPILPLRTGDS